MRGVCKEGSIAKYAEACVIQNAEVYATLNCFQVSLHSSPGDTRGPVGFYGVLDFRMQPPSMISEHLIQGVSVHAPPYFGKQSGVGQKVGARAIRRSVGPYGQLQDEVGHFGPADAHYSSGS